MKNDTKIRLLVKSSSSSEPHSVDIIVESDKMFVFCSCPAGKYGKFCKHKIRVMQGDFDILYDDYQLDDVARIADWIQESDFLDLIFERSKFKSELREAEERLEAVKKKMKPVEKRIAQAMKDGIKLKS